MERKRLMEIIGSIFIGIIFLSSYLAFGNNSSGTQNGGGTAKTTTIGHPPVYAVGTAIANISLYGPVMNINVSCKNASTVLTRLNDLLAAYQSNGSISNSQPVSDNQILVWIGNESALDLSVSLASAIGPDAAACTTFSLPQARVQLPASVSLYVPQAKISVSVTIPDSMRSYPLQLAISGNLLKSLNLTVTALLFQNGTIYYNNMTVTKS